MHCEIINVDILDKILQSLTIFPQNPKIAVAVSGGRDSMCLVVLMKEWALRNNAELTAIIVDHKLRKESTVEAQDVKEALEKLGIKAVILKRKEIALITGIQKQAREDRYQLIKEYCKENHIIYLLVAHHLDDQIETMLMREQKGESIVGNAGMSAKVVDDSVILLRPLLGIKRQQITNTLKALGIKWVEDPSNKNTKYKRVEIRNNIAELSNDEYTQLKIRLKQYYIERREIEEKFVNFVSRGVKINILGLIKINLSLFKEYEESFQTYVLRKLLKFVANKEYGVKLKKVKKFLQDLKESNYELKQISLGNCNIFLEKDSKSEEKNLTLAREVRYLETREIVISNQYYFDNRFIIMDQKGATIRFLDKKEIYKYWQDREIKEYFKPLLYKIDNMRLIPFLDLRDMLYIKKLIINNLIILKAKEGILINTFVFI